MSGVRLLSRLSRRSATTVASKSPFCRNAQPWPLQLSYERFDAARNHQHQARYRPISSYNFMSSLACAAANKNETDKNSNDNRTINSILEELGVTNVKVRDDRSPTAGRRKHSRRKRQRKYIDTSLLDEKSLLGFPKSTRGVRIIYESPIAHRVVVPEVEISDRIPVKAVHAAATIDVVSVLGKVFGGATSSASTLGELGIGAPTRHVFGKNGTSILFQLPPPEPAAGQTFDPSPRFVAVFKFGSVVFHNMTTQESGSILSEIKKHASDPVSYGFEKTERFEVAVQPDMPKATGEVTSEFATVKELDLHSVAVISKIMAQTVALDSYADTVDALLSAFAAINTSVKNTGNFSPMDKETLFKVVAQNNSLMLSIIGKLGIKDRSDIAWELSEYDNVYEGMKEEFELEDRFDAIEFKLNTIQSNAKFFLEMLAHQKSTSLEWIIVVLIAFESALMILEMSGQGEKIFSFS